MILQNLSKEIYPVSNYEVFSDIGWIQIQYAIKTIELKKYVVLFQSGREVSCADVHIFIDNEYREIYAKDLFEGKTLLTEDGIDTVFDVFETDEFCEMYDINLPYHNLFYANGVLSHNSAMMINMAARQVLKGHNVVMITLEMSEDAIAQRMDAIYSGLDINRIYVVKDVTKTLIKKLDDLNTTPGIGKLYIKEFPTGDASVVDIKRYLRELKMRGVIADIVYVDYINLMKSSNKNINDIYGTVKKIAEELRAMSFAFDIPVVSVSQLNREGSNIINLREIDFTHISESMGLPATADFVGIFGSDDETVVYKSEMGYKIVKNRLGGRVGEIDKLFIDTRTLKLYDRTELDVWLADATTSMDERALAVPRERQPARVPGRRN